MKIKTTLFVIFFISLLFLTNGVIIDLKLDNFKQHFGCDLQDYLSFKDTPKRDWLIMFMAPWCGHCKQAKPVFQNFADAYTTQLIKNHQDLNQDEIGQLIDSSLQIAVVDCTLDRQLCQYFNIKGFPTVVYLTGDKKGIQYVGPRTVQGFKNFTKYHDPDQNHLYCKNIQVSHSYWSDFKQHFVASVKQYWVELIVFSIIIPSILGYFLGQWFYGKRNKGTSKQNTTSPITEQPKQTSNENQKKNQ